MLILGLGIFLLVIGLVLFYGMRMKILEEENRLWASYMHTAQEFYQGIQEKMEAVRRYRHDLAKHIQTLESLLTLQDTGGKEQVSIYIEGLKQEFAELKHRQFCQDEIVEAVLDMKVLQCRELEIPIEISVEDCLYQEMEEADIVGLLCNLLDNAIEANLRCGQRERKGIWFTMGKREGEIWIKVENCMTETEEFSFITKKRKKEEHGIGTKIIGGLVEKYQGIREIQADREKKIVTDKIYLCRRNVPWN